LILKALYEKYRGRSFLDRVRLDQDKKGIVMSEDEHPDRLFARAATVRRKYMFRVSKPTYDELVGSIVSGAAEYYRGFMTSELTRLEALHGADVWDERKVDVIKELQKLATSLYESRHIEDLPGGDTQLSAVQEDPDSKPRGRGKGRKPIPTCRICEKKGHNFANCWELPQNKDNRPPNWISCLDVPLE